MRLRHSIVAVVCSLAIVVAAPRSASARWHSGGQLPGIVSGGELIRSLLVMGGVAAGGAFVVYKLLGRNRPDGVRPIRGKVTFEPGAASGEVTLVNASTTPVRVLSVALRQGTAFQLAPDPGVSMPLELAPQQPLRIKVLFSSPAPGRYEDEVRVSTRGSAAEQVRVVKVGVRAASAELSSAPVVAGAVR